MSLRRYRDKLNSNRFVYYRVFLITLLLISFGCSDSSVEIRSPYTIVLFPDTQKYKNSLGISRDHIFEAQTQWVANHLISDNIVLAIHLGDVVDVSNDIQWLVALNSLKIIQDLIPVVFTEGNKDIMLLNDSLKYEVSPRLFLKYLPTENIEKKLWFGGCFKKGFIENCHYHFKFGAVSYLVITLEYGPRDVVLDWANKIVDAYPQETVIVATHAYMDKGDVRLKPGVKLHPKFEEIPYPPENPNDRWPNGGEAIWNKFIKKHSNIQMVVSGHVKGPGKLISLGNYGNPVYQMATNYQWDRNGGDGFMRLMKFYPSKNQISIRTYSPTLNEYKIDSDNEFIIDLNKETFIVE